MLPWNLGYSLMFRGMGLKVWVGERQPRPTGWKRPEAKDCDWPLPERGPDRFDRSLGPLFRYLETS